MPVLWAKRMFVLLAFVGTAGLMLILAAASPGYAQDCPGDCDRDGSVAVHELVRGVNISLELADVSACGAVDANGDERVTVDELVLAVKSFITVVAGCMDDRSLATPFRRLTQLEYAHTLQDLLEIPEDAALELGRNLPPEADSGGFDTLADGQGISGLHIRSYLQAADRALDAAIELGPAPPLQPHVIDFTKGYPVLFATAQFFGGGMIALTEDAAVQFHDSICTYSLDTERNGFVVQRAGDYRVTMEAYRYQSDATVVATLFRGRTQGLTASLDELIGAWDMVDDETRVLEVTTHLSPGQLLSPCVAETRGVPGDNIFDYLPADKFARDYRGSGVAFKYIKIEPLIDSWPPTSTRSLLTGVNFSAAGQIELSKTPELHLRDIIARFARRAFRRPVRGWEVEAIAALGEAVLDQGRPFIEAVRIPLRAILSSPEFLYQPADREELDDYELATRLAYFLWRSAPDAVLHKHAQWGRLSDESVLRGEVDRLLSDAKSQRFVVDFAGQAFRLDEIRRTTPALGLGYDERLGQAMEQETHLFLRKLINDDLGAGNLIESDFTFVNRRLATLYKMNGIEGQQMRQVRILPDTPRGGLLTQASILKITANGTSTSPVPRGNFVLANLLGTPAPPPPPGVTGLEPDTRGTTTIREQLDAHRTEPVCNSCHSFIDPPGFALESFDAIGAFRTRYRGSRLPVDASGVTPDGRTFDGIQDYKQILLDEQLDQVARSLASRLLVFATGAELEPADRSEVERILDKLRGDGFPIRSMIREIVASSVFRRRAS